MLSSIITHPFYLYGHQQKFAEKNSLAYLKDYCSFCFSDISVIFADFFVMQFLLINLFTEQRRHRTLLVYV